MKHNIISKLRARSKSAVESTQQLRDIRLLGLYVFVVIALLVTWNSIGVIQSNYELQQNLARLQQENDIQKLENDTLKLRNEYYQTDQFLELAARKQFSKAAPGETLVLVPKEVALKHSFEQPSESTTQANTPAKPKYQQNFEAWMEFFFRRNAEI